MLVVIVALVGTSGTRGDAFATEALELQWLAPTG